MTEMNDMPIPITEIPVGDLTGWLRSHRWDRVGGGSLASLWRRGGTEVLVPMRLDAVDSAKRMRQLLDDISRVERRPATDIAWEIASEGLDVSEWRAAGNEITAGYIPLLDGERLVSGVKSAIVAAAGATLHRKGYFGHSTPHQARDHVKHVRMGRPRSGSYIIPIVSPLRDIKQAADPETLDFTQPIEPYDRQVLLTLADSLSAVHELAVSSPRRPSQRAINESVAVGVSHELCAAVALVLTSSSIDEFDVSFAWARRSVPRSRAYEVVRFPKEAAGNVSLMSEALRGSPVVAEQTLTGFVYGLRRTATDRHGAVTVQTPVGGRVRNVTMYLTEDYYALAASASASREMVTVRGRLTRAVGKTWYLDQVSSFTRVAKLNSSDID